MYSKARNRLAIARAEKLVFIKGTQPKQTSSDMEVMLTVLEQGDDLRVRGRGWG